ncbi:hypothetical protein KSP40_PGU020597 [Platanthera guangdongensis]|uniref:Ubiquitin-like domain-containing protein n=1 Tax=Platanthera guangdongensis TaxID=2320717 RepID=A0ABR2LWJ3_9ASPA
MDIVIQTPDGLCFKMREIWYCTTVLQIKEMIQKTYGIPVSSNTLSFNGVIMEDGLQIHNYGLIEGSRVILHLRLPEPGPEILRNINPGGALAGPPAQPPFPVTARFPFFRIRVFGFYIDASTVASTHLKERLRRDFLICTGKRCPPSWTMSLFYGGVELSEGRCLVEYGIGLWSVIEVRRLAAAAGEIDLWETLNVAVALPAPTSPAGTVMLDVEIYADDNVSQLWEELVLITSQWPATMVYCIVFKQAVMKEDRSFRWHGVQSGDLIQIISGPRHQ